MITPEGIVTAVIATTLEAYYAAALQRQPLEPLLSTAVIDPSTARPLHFFRGMMNFEPGDRFVGTLAAEAVDLRVFRYAGMAEKQLLRPWASNATEIVNRFAARPELIGERPVMVGHSAGGFPVYLLAAIARGTTFARLRAALPGVEIGSERDFQTLSEHLRDGLFVAIGTPFNGVEMTPLGRRVNAALVEPWLPEYFSGVTRENLASFYGPEKIGLHPSQVMDGIIYSKTSSWGLGGGPGSMATIAMVQGALRLFSRFVKLPLPGDGIVPAISAELQDVLTVLLHLNHLKMIETEEGARALLGLIARLDAAHDEKRLIL